MHSEGFILSSTFRDFGRSGTGLVFQGRLSQGKRFRWTVTEPRFCFFVEHDAPNLSVSHVRKPLPLKTFQGKAVDVLYFRSQADLARARREGEASLIRLYEADVPAPARHLMERGIRGGIRFLDPPVSELGNILDFRDGRVETSDFTPSLRLLSLDIECSSEEKIFSISVYGDALVEGEPAFAEVFLLDPAFSPGTIRETYRAFPDERSLLTAFFSAVKNQDPDVLIGWSVVNFDLRVLARKCVELGISFALGTDGPAELIEPDGSAYGRLGSNWLARIPGRAVLDGIAMLKAAFISVDSYSLANVAEEILGKRKLIELEGQKKVAEIERQYREDKPSLARYNLEDSILVHNIFTKLSLSQLAVRKTQLTGLSVDRMGGSIAAFDFLYLPKLHRMGFVADTANRDVDDDGVPGGLVLEGLAGIHSNVLVLDFKSLYPSIIRTFQIDPLAAAAVQFNLVPYVKAEAETEANPEMETNPERETKPGTVVQGPVGPAFQKNVAILPGIIEKLWEARDLAKQIGDKSLSQAVKIIMNSLYGVLGTPACRFYHPDLAGTITRIGQWVLLESKHFLEVADYKVIYGDTDSLFVALEGRGEIDFLRATGSKVASTLNSHLHQLISEKFHTECCLNIVFEKLFLRFFMPALRNEDRGSKKRYAGLMLSGAPGKTNPVLHFTGLESARSDWTRLAKDFQAELLSLVFKQENLEDKVPLEQLTREWNRKLFAGEKDLDLIYRKGLSKHPEEYVGTAPPHVRAARLLDELDSRIIRYIMTVDGPEPIQKLSGAKPNYAHYAEKQLAPIADMVLRFYGTNFQSLMQDSSQMNIF